VRQAGVGKKRHGLEKTTTGGEKGKGVVGEPKEKGGKVGE